MFGSGYSLIPLAIHCMYHVIMNFSQILTNVTKTVITVSVLLNVTIQRAALHAHVLAALS